MKKVCPLRVRQGSGALDEKGDVLPHCECLEENCAWWTVHYRGEKNPEVTYMCCAIADTPTQLNNIFGVMWDRSWRKS